MFLAESDTASRAEWVAALRIVQAFGAEHVVAAHKDPDRDDDPVAAQETIDYLLDVEEAPTATSSAIEFYQAVLARHPRRVNFSATLCRRLQHLRRTQSEPGTAQEQPELLESFAQATTPVVTNG